ncbi:uncharacterized protein LOC129605563 [Condylostylus longicornis]|uniref:uncharacterized protein LOC129605563 n=1 Tax=Condylostylus longicornis TaxID=2530218 RepID=UPI00244E513F|nr:uncharacterized protein LOC129605563 [Condylostylus longicornis]
MNKPKNILDLTVDEKKEFLKSFDMVLSDCDGVLWHGKTPIENSGKGINLLQAANKRIGYISNNSGRSDQEYEEMFRACDINFDLNNLCHTVKNITSYLKHNKFEGKIYAIGSKSLHEELKSAGFEVIEEPNYAEEESFIGFLQYISVKEKVSAVILHGYWNVSATNLVRAQVYLSENPECLFITGASDMFLKFRDKNILGPGMFTKMLADCTNQKPIVLSKPGIDLCDIVLKKFNINDPKRVVMIGDMLDQDIAFGKICKFQTLAVLTGGATLEDFDKAEHRKVLPDFYANSLGDFIQFFDELDCENVEK